jgi:ubiquinone/menaquinone biosynthesis C-methylase UbiE
MEDNTERFTGRAEGYDRYRQRYPSGEILPRLREWCGLKTESVVADIGAGTGMLAEVFLENGNRVLAVEPNAEMRAVCKRLRETWPRLEVIDATAEDTALPEATVDMVAAGRAFHWFDRQQAQAEFRRILKPGGWVMLVAIDRSRDGSDSEYCEQIEDFEHLLASQGTDYARVLSGFRSHDNMEQWFDREIHQAQLHDARKVDWEIFRGHAMSLSVTPQVSHPNFDNFQRDLRCHFETFSRDGVLTIPTTCWITAARLERV